MYLQCYRKTAVLLLAALLGLLCACGGTEPAPSAPPESEPLPKISEESEMEELPVEEVSPGIDFVRPEVTMLVMNYENDNIIEIPQLTWEDESQENASSRAINERILKFAEGYEEYVDGHPEEYTCEIQTTAHFINMYIMIVMRKAYYPSYGSDPETETFLYNYVFGEEGVWKDMITSELSQEEMEAMILEAAATGTELTAESCELTGYTWTHFGDLYFYDVTVKNAEGEPSMASWACLEDSLADNPREILPGDEAFARLKAYYTDLPPDFDKDPGNPPEKYVSIVHDVKSDQDGRSWSYAASGEGAVQAVEYEEYQEWLEAVATEEAGDTLEEGETIVYDELPPGLCAYYFKGEKPGDVTLHFVYADPSKPDAVPEWESVCVVEVQEDLTLRLISREDTGEE